MIVLARLVDGRDTDWHIFKASDALLVNVIVLARLVDGRDVEQARCSFAKISVIVLARLVDGRDSWPALRRSRYPA